MKCPKCAVNIPKNTAACPQCGTIIQPIEQQAKVILQNETKRKIAWPLIILPIFIVLCCISLVIVVAAGLIVQQSDFSLSDLIPDKVDQIFTQEPVLDESPSWVSESPDSMQHLLELSEQATEQNELLGDIRKVLWEIRTDQHEKNTKPEQEPKKENKSLDDLIEKIDNYISSKESG